MPRETLLAVESKLAQLSFVAAAVRRVAEPVVGPEAAALVDVAVTEICSNIVRHAHPGEPGHSFLIMLRPKKAAIEVEVRDEGPAYAMGPHPMPDVEVPIAQMPEGGFGLALVAATMDEFEEWRDGTVNVTRILKRRR